MPGVPQYSQALIKMIKLQMKMKQSHWPQTQESKTLCIQCSVGIRWQDANSTFSNYISNALLLNSIAMILLPLFSFSNLKQKQRSLCCHAQIFINSFYKVTTSYVVFHHSAFKSAVLQYIYMADNGKLEKKCLFKKLNTFLYFC